MGLVGISLIIASLVYLCMYPQTWSDLARPLLQWRRPPPPPPIIQTTEDKQTNENKPTDDKPTDDKLTDDKLTDKDEPTDEDEPTTPKASAQPGAAAVPAFSLSEPTSPSSPDSPDSMPPPMFPAPFSAQRAGGASNPSLAARSAAPARAPSAGLMAPPPPPGRRPPTLSPAAAARNNSLLVPNRGLRAPPTASSSSSLAPPPTTETRPNKPNARNKVILTPGHSPLDWARLTADPHANLRNLPPEAPQLLRVTPSMLKTMNGRRGRDAWTALGGMVYNLTPYVPFHPGGAGELLRCAGRDGNRLFNEVHSWVNYDNMLAACRVGILVEEHESGSNPMEEMD